MANNGTENETLCKELVDLRKNLVLQGTDLNKLSGLKLQLDQEEKQSAGLKHKLASQETELTLVKTKLQKLETEQQQLSGQTVVAAPNIQCPMCSQDVKKPMRLQQCLNVSLISCCAFSYLSSFVLQGHIICEGCYSHLRITATKDRLCITCSSQYIGRPRTLEQILDLVEPNIVIDE